MTFRSKKNQGDIDKLSTLISFDWHKRKKYYKIFKSLQSKKWSVKVGAEEVAVVQVQGREEPVHGGVDAGTGQDQGTDRAMAHTGN